MDCSGREKYLRFSHSLLFLAIALGCSDKPSADSEQRIRDVLSAQVDAWNSGDVDGYMQGYLHSDTTIFVSGGSRTSGYDSVLARYKRAYPTKEAMGRLSFEDLEVVPISADAWMARGVWRLARSEDEPWGRFTLVFQEFDGNWRIIYDHTSSAPREQM